MKLTRTFRRGAFAFVDLLMIMAALAAMAFVILPRRARVHGCCRINCTNNLKQIGLAYRQWAIDNNDKYPAAVSTADSGAKEWIEAGAVYTSFLVMSNELNTPKILVCPEGIKGAIVTATTFGFPFPPGVTSSWIPLTNNNNVTYFVGLDADETKPQRILSGDDNFLVGGAKPKPGVLSLWTNTPVAWSKDRHISYGNIGMADGSVLGIITPMWRKVLVNTGTVTNRLAMP